MSKSIEPCTYRNGFKQPSEGEPWLYPKPGAKELPAGPHYVTPQSVEIVTAPVNNALGQSVLRSWPTIFNGTNSPDGVPDWWNPSTDVDVLIVGGKYLQKCNQALPGENSV